MTRHFDGSSDIAYVTSEPLGSIGGPIVSAWLYRDDNSQSTRIVFEYDQTNGFDVAVNVGSGNDLIRSYHGASQWSDHYVSPAAGAWHHYLWIIPGSGEGIPPPASGLNQVWIDGSQATLTTVTHSGVGALAASSIFSIMGRRVGTTNSLFMGGKIAEFAMWSSHAMLINTAPFAKGLAAGACPLTVRKEEMLMYVPFFGESPEPDFHGAQRSVTIAGTTVERHPPTVRSMVALQD